MKKYLIFIFFISFVTICYSQVSINALSTAYTQDFNTLANSGTSSVVPAGWAFLEIGSNANLVYSAGTGSGNAGDTYSFGSSGVTERSFGGLKSGSLNPCIGAQFTNNTGATITQLDISYVGEQWRCGTTGRLDRLDFLYSLDATNLSNGTWIDVNALDFSTPNQTGPVGALNGNLSGNKTAISASITGLSIAPGSSFWIKWTDFEASGADDGLSIDDFSITALGVVPSGPEINITANNTSITDGDTSPSTTDHTDFGSACETSGTVTRTFTIENTGVNDLTVSSINLSGTNAADFSVSGITLPATIAASSSTTFSVTFDPSATGTRTATISLANDDTNENPYDFSIQGTGTASALITSPVSGSPFCLDPDAAVNVSFTSSCITFNGANIFTAQLSDNTGSFASPTVIGTLSSSATSGTISATIPSGTPTGTGYRIRVVSSSPAFTANDNGSDLSISSSPCVLQVPYITAVLINSCDGTCTEGQNEIVFLNSGDYSIPVSPSDIILKYQSTSPPSTTYTDGFTSNTSYINTLNDSANCGTLFYDALTVGTIPANSAFLIMRQDPCYGYNFNSFCGGGPIYVLFSTDGSWQTSGNFVNSDNDATPERYFRTDFTASIPGSVIDYNYDASVIVNADGAGVTYGPAGGDPTSYFNNNDCTPPPIVLPIDLIHFTATPKSSSVHLSWATATEINNDYFTLLRSHDGKAFSELTQIPGKGNSNTVNEYYFTDENPLKGTSYYRLKQTDFDGASSMSEIVPVKFDSGSSEISITQNEELIFITVHKDNSKYINSVLISLSGQRIFEETFSGSGTYTIKKPFTKGLYILSVTTAASQTSQKIIVH